MSVIRILPAISSPIGRTRGCPVSVLVVASTTRRRGTESDGFHKRFPS